MELTLSVFSPSTFARMRADRQLLPYYYMAFGPFLRWMN